MSAFRKLVISAKLNRRTMLLFTEAYLLLGWARIQVIFPFSRLARRLGTPSEETSEAFVPSDSATVKHIRSAVNLMSRYTPWDSKCLVRAVAGQVMLNRRCIESTLYLGTAKDEQGRLIAHAWLRSGPLFITGDDLMHDFTVVQSFAKFIIK
ncbi:lasso peptide biosynthesis B2 protein [Cohnella soli]|uniref:Lasso peptide biosynthesis B2 protein n=1 Tax=Cohnella soli TaxID=425005 RepID=A0ABW0HZY0_9BACL